MILSCGSVVMYHVNSGLSKLKQRSSSVVETKVKGSCFALGYTAKVSCIVRDVIPMQLV